MQEGKKGIFVISLDFELHWGVSDHFSPEEYAGNLNNTPKAIDGILQIFNANNIHCTWATVGMLFCKNKAELFEYVDESKRPVFKNPQLSNYLHAEKAGDNEHVDPYHYGLSIIKKISNYPNQEISTHTFSHYYCLEEPINPPGFEADIKAAIVVGQRNNFSLKSIVFPRNQVLEANLDACAKEGIVCYRGTQNTWFHKPVTQKNEKKIFKRIFRLSDHYFNLTGSNGYDMGKILQPYSVKNIPQSRFLRPYSKKISILERFRVNRIKKEMTSAARSGKMYHLWWHPHNFGNDVEGNLNVLAQIIAHFKWLENKYGMKSMTMLEVYNNFFAKK